MKTLSDHEIAALARKKWLGCSDVAKMLQVCPSTVKNLWNSGRLSYKCANNTQRTRKSSLAMIRSYQEHQMLY